MNISSPYVISADLERHFNQFSELHKGIDRFRESLVQDLQEQGKEVLYLPFENIHRGIAEYIRKTNLPVVSMDRIYVDQESVDAFLDISRSCDGNFLTKTYTQRLGSLDLEEQFRFLGSIFDGQEIVLTDDVLFTGKIIEYVTNRLAEKNVRIGGLICGVAVGEGINRIKSMGIDLEVVHEFEQVEDEVCERDFTALPSAGRPIIDKPGIRSLYWVPRPFSDHESAASINEEHIGKFFESTLIRNLCSFGTSFMKKAINNVLGREFLHKEIDRLKLNKEE